MDIINLGTPIEHGRTVRSKAALRRTARTTKRGARWFFKWFVILATLPITLGAWVCYFAGKAISAAHRAGDMQFVICCLGLGTAAFLFFYAHTMLLTRVLQHTVGGV